MGARLSKPGNAQPEKPQLYAVATPHPTLQYIYPVYAAPMDVSNVAEKAQPERDLNKGRKSSLAWRNDKKRTKESIQIVNDHGDLVSVAQPTTDGMADGMQQGFNEDGTWYHFHVDAAGAVDYIRPGTTLPNAYNTEPMYTPQTDGGIGPIGLTPSHSLAGVPYEESYYSYPASPYQGQQQIYQHPEPHHVSQGQSEYSMGSSHHPQVYYSPHPRPYDPRSQDGYSHHDPHAYAYAHPRARSVSPVHMRSMTPSNPKPRRATTPTPPRHSSRQPMYDPAPPMPQHINPIPSSRRAYTPFPRGKSLPTQSPRLTADADEDYIIQPRERDREHKTVAFASGHPSGRTSRNGRRPSADIRSGDEESTAISSIGQPEGSSSSSALKAQRPTSPTPLSDYSSAGTRERVRERERDHEKERSYSKRGDPARHYPSPPADASHSRRLDVHAA